MKFLRRGWYKHKRIGKGKKRKVGWRKPKGRDNKMRENKKGKPPIVSVGYKRQKENRKKIIVHSIKDLENTRRDDFILLGKMGKKKKIEIVRKALELGFEFQNLNIKRFLKNESK